MTSTPAMWQFAGIYLNQDWPEDHGSWEAAVDAFVSDSPALASPLCEEIAAVLAGSASEEDLAEFMSAQGAAYSPASGEHGYRDLLVGITQRVSEALK